MKRWVKASGIKIGARMDELSGYAPSGIAYRLHAYSKHVTSLADDMPETERQVGYAFSEPEPFEPSGALTAFLDEDTPPIYIGFGSMPGTDHQRINDALMGAVKKTGQRAVVATGWGGIGELEDNERIHVLDSIPHSWLFPRVAAVVHHGGSGTTHEGLRWGKPSMICPMFADQPFFGQRVYELGAGPAPIPQKKITADRLAAGIEITLSDATISSAKSLGEKMVNEDGAAAIAKMIEPLS